MPRPLPLPATAAAYKIYYHVKNFCATMRQQKLKTRECEATVQLLPSRVKSAFPVPPLPPTRLQRRPCPRLILCCAAPLWQFVLVDNLFEYFA